MDGIVVRFNEHRGFGFVRPLAHNPNAESIFFHVSQLNGLRSVPVGSRIAFVLVDGRNGKPQAANIRLRTLSGKEIGGRTGLADEGGKR